MRDDVPGLADLKLPARPRPAAPAPRVASRVNTTSFLSQLNQATKTRAASQSDTNPVPKKYESPLARRVTTQPQLTRTQTRATNRPPTTTAQDRATLQSSAKTPAVARAQSSTTITRRAAPGNP